MKLRPSTPLKVAVGLDHDNPVILSYNVDALFKKLGVEKGTLTTIDEWHCGYCSFANTSNMLDCHHCGAPKP